MYKHKKLQAINSVELWISFQGLDSATIKRERNWKEEKDRILSSRLCKGVNKNLASRSHVLHLVLQHSSKRKYMVTKCNHFDWRKWRHKPEKIGILQMIIIIDTIDRGQAKKQNIFESTYIYSTSRTKPLFDSKGQRIFFFSGCRLDLSCAFTGYGTLWGLYSLKSELIPLVFFSLYISRKDISEYVLRGGQTTQDCFLKGNCCFMAVEFSSENYLQSKEYFLEWQELSEFYQGRVCQFAE